MAKTELTVEMERQIYGATKKRGVFGCFEVTIGWYGKERVDYLTYDTKGIWRCYEVKVSLADFRSNSFTTFVGHYNYYVMPEELYEKVKYEIPKHIGVYVGKTLVKRARKQELGVDEDVLKNSFIRSLYREADKVLRSKNPSVVESLQRQLRNERKLKEEYRRKYQEERRKVEPRSRRKVQ
ncbi:hypothetical protein [Bacillus thuringiensis]|uniref:hypothetical protein n=1 Tax=Bacillus thuringiensis TaxID=1428 RepID=UPI000BFD9F79|nr:hypothetical protein [Bacillus thuringiensis]PGT90068.1 hypothetical protein COD17_09975 [Bacillus thuringiensis]